jgi:glycosyltransferase involved in cell wall biosynthesis
MSTKRGGHTTVVPRIASASGATASPVLDLVVPVFNESATLTPSIERLHAFLSRDFPFSWRITIADNASTDDTSAIATRLAAALPRVRIVHLEAKGRGRALREAWRTSNADIVAYTDVDLSTDLNALLPLVAPLVSGHSDISIGSRLTRNAVVARGPRRELISRTYNLLLRALFATQVRDAQCGFKALRADIARGLLPAIEDNGWFFDTELLLLAERNGLRIHEVPVDWTEDTDSRVNILTTAWADLRGIARMLRRFLTRSAMVTLPGERAPLADDFGRRLVTFAVIGTVSTAVSIALFLLTRNELGPIGANAVAVTTTFLGNTWANRRFTVGAAVPRRHWLDALAVYVGSLLLTSGALALVAAVGGGVAMEVLALVITWTAATIGRLAMVWSWSHRRMDTSQRV